MADWKQLRTKYARGNWDSRTDGFVNLLPDQVSTAIFQKLDINDLLSASMVSSKWHHMCTDDELWKPIYKRRYRVTKTHPDAWVGQFAKQYKRSDTTWATNHPSLHVVKLERPARAMQFNESFAVIAQDNNLIQIPLNQAEAQQACIWEGHEAPVTCLQFDDRLLLSGGDDGCLKIWQLASDGPKAPEPTVNIRPDPGLMGCAGITTLRFDELRGICGRSGGLVDIWDMEASRASMRISAHPMAITDLQFDDYRLATCSLDGCLKLWDMRGQCTQPIQTINTGGPLYAFQYNLDRVMIGCSDGSVGVWDMRSAKGITRYTLSASTTTVSATTTTMTAFKQHSPITTLAFDAQFLMAGTVGGVVHLVQHNHLNTTTSSNAVPFATTLLTGDGSKGGVSACQFDPAAGRIVAATLDQPALYVYSFLGGLTSPSNNTSTPMITV
eukprot:TRINITY_DN1044_c0_g1_i1.p1 TRINITY_DN1044_c0_g1~~TRINITY_DN1044_c0_g1_i1.p1  ORF type:complete len:441 (+),score=66.94 TRINITY_DN1044_c0_g1_i1:130-1452(+)